MGKTFTLDRRNGKMCGVCAGIANHFDIDATIVRVGVVVLTIVGGFPWTVIAYGVAAWLGKPQASEAAAGVAGVPHRTSTADVRESMRDIDRRLAEIDRYVTTPNRELSREIEELR